MSTVRVVNSLATGGGAMWFVMEGKKIVAQGEEANGQVAYQVAKKTQKQLEEKGEQQ